MIERADILSMEFLKKSEFTGGYKGMRYRVEKVVVDEENQLQATIWPEPFNFFTTPAEQKQSALFTFDEDGVVDAIAWMNDRYFEGKKQWEEAPRNWDSYRLPES